MASALALSAGDSKSAAIARLSCPTRMCFASMTYSTSVITFISYRNCGLNVAKEESLTGKSHPPLNPSRAQPMATDFYRTARASGRETLNMRWGQATAH